MNISDFKYEEYDKNRKVIIYGNDEFSVMASYCLKQLSIPLFCYADEKGSMLPDVPIIGIKELKTIYEEDKPIILMAVSSKFFGEHLKIMQDAAIYDIYTVWSLLDAVNFMKSDYDECIKNIYKDRHFDILLQEQIIKPDGLFIRSIDAVVSEKCSLKCRDCSNLMQYYEHPQNLNIDEIKKSIDILLTKADRIWELRIIGGEPFMNQDFVKLVDAYANEPKIWNIVIWSNATIFPSEEILEHLKCTKMHIRFSDYGELSRKLDAWENWCKENEIIYTIIKKDIWQDCGKLEKHNYSEFDLREIYSTCECRNLPTILKNRLYCCPYAANAANLMAMDPDDMNNDSILLTEDCAISKKDIDRFLYERPYLEACKYCNGRNYARASVEAFVQTKNPLSYEKRFLGDSISISEQPIGGAPSPINDLVSIIVPVYNTASFVEKCINSVIKQTYKNLEIIIIDDGSTDGSIEICENLAKKDSRIQFIQSDHKGVVHARNIGIEHANGKFMMFADSDDWMEEKYIEQMIESMGKCDVLISGYVYEEDISNLQIASKIMDRGQSTWQYRHVSVKEGRYEKEDVKLIWKYMFHHFEHYEHSIDPSLWAKVFQTSLMKQIYDKIDDKIWLSEDRALTHVYLSCCATVNIVGPKGYHYCKRGNDGINERYNYDGVLANYERYYHCLKKAFQGHQYEKELLSDLYMEFVDVMEWRLQHDYELYNICRGSMTYYPYYGRLKGKKVILYGAGNVGKAFRRHILQDGDCDLVLWVDKNPRKYQEEQWEVSDVRCILEQEYDYIIVAVALEDIYELIKEELLLIGVSEEKILWNKIKWGW